MRCELKQITAVLVKVCLLLTLAIKCGSFGTNPALDAFFSELDNNHDGAIDVEEASKFIGGSIGGQEFDEPQEAKEAAASFLHSIDGGDAGLTVSVHELDKHLHAVLSGVRVSEWIRHGVGLPQYAEAFRVHSITPLDFPVLVQDNGKILEEELGVSSPFHRSKVVRAIRRLILGLGQPPMEPQAVNCTAASHAGSGPRARLHWSPPAHPGVPPLHRYVLERAGSDGAWRQVAELDDPEPAAVAVMLEQPQAAAAAGQEGGAAAQEGGGVAAVAGQQALYRVAAWNLYGRSPYGVAACRLEPAPPPGYPLVAAPPDAVNGSAAGAAAVAGAPAGDRRVVPGGGGGGGWGGGWGAVSPVGGGAVGPVPGAAAQATTCPGGRGGDVLGGGDAQAVCWQQQQQQQQQPPPGQGPAEEPLLPMPMSMLMRQEPGGLGGGGGVGGPDGSTWWHGNGGGGGGSGDGAVVTAGGGGGGGGGGGSALVRSVWAPGSEARGTTRGGGPQPHPQPHPQSHSRSWWGTLLWAALPWLLRLLPLRVLQAAVGWLQGLLLRAHAAAGRRPPDWLLQPQRQQPKPLVSAPGAAWPTHGSVWPAQPPPGGPAATATAAGRAGGGGGGGGGGGSGQAATNPGAADPGASGGGGAEAGGAEAGGAGPLRRTSWLDGVFVGPGQPVPPGAVAATGAAPVAVPVPLASQRSGLPPYRPPAAAAAPSPYGSPGSDASGMMMTMMYGGGEGSRRQRAGSGPPPPLPPPHRSTSEGDICGLEDAERPSRPCGPHHAPTNPHQSPGSPSASPSASLHSHLTPHQLAGSAPSLGMSLGLGLLSAAGGSQAGAFGGGGGGGGGGLRDVGTEGDLMAAAAAAAAAGGCGAGGGVGVSGRGRGKVCAIPGCCRKLDLRHYRDFMRRHYCGRCQRTVCGQHTAYSPHGPAGSCDHVSRCVCTSCFTHFNPAYQLFLLKHNKIQPGPGVGPPQGVGTSTTAAVGAAGLAPFQGQPDVRVRRSASGDGGGGRGGGGGVSAGGSGSGNGVVQGQDSKSAAKLLWERAATKLQAVTRFRKKGVEGHDRELRALEGIAE